LPSAYVAGATGVLQNQEEYNNYKQIGLSNKTNANKYSPPAGSITKTLSYSAENVHDFAWFADKNFIIEYDTLQLATGRIIDVFAYHQPNGNPLWEKSTDYIEDAVRHYSAWVGEYPYPVVAAVEGPKNLMSGGMEYPMITHITSPEVTEERLDAVITHEVGHNWFYSVLGSNEREHAWMDEGINSYYQFRYEAQKYKSNSIFGDDIPAEVKTKTEDEFQALVYNALGGIPMEKPIETHSASFKDKEEYGLVIYIKTAIWMYILQLNLGKAKMDAAMQAYFNEWKFKHPYPEDFKASLEKSLNTKLEELFEIRNKSGSLQ
jgi:aminopeptidase N